MRISSHRHSALVIAIVSIGLTVSTACDSSSRTAGVVTIEPWYDGDTDADLLDDLIDELGKDAEYLSEGIVYKKDGQEITASSNPDCIRGVRKMRNEKWRNAADSLELAVAAAEKQDTNFGIDCLASFALGVCYEQLGEEEQDRNERKKSYRLAQEQYEKANEQCYKEGRPYNAARLRVRVKLEVLKRGLDLTE